MEGTFWRASLKGLHEEQTGAGSRSWEDLTVGREQLAAPGHLGNPKGR